MRVEEIMTKDVSYCAPGTNAAEAAELMWTRNCGSLPVVEDGGHVVGMITDRDLFIALGTQDRRPADLPVGEIMNRDLSICAPGDDLRQALKTMAEKQSHRLPVVDENGALKGILSIDDIVLRAEADGLSKDVLKAMKAICERRSAVSKV
jgi:CBS domain-containing protein